MAINSLCVLVNCHLCRSFILLREVTVSGLTELVAYLYALIVLVLGLTYDITNKNAIGKYRMLYVAVILKYLCA